LFTFFGDTDTISISFYLYGDQIAVLKGIWRDFAIALCVVRRITSETRLQCLQRGSTECRLTVRLADLNL
jgi:hypothetical protein